MSGIAPAELASARAQTARQLCLLFRGHPDLEHGALARLALNRDGTPVHIDDPPGDRQPQTGAAVFAGTRLIRPPESIEDVDQILRSDPDPRIRHKRNRPPAALLQSDLDRTAAGRI